jgi:hypothetical protein
VQSRLVDDAAARGVDHEGMGRQRRELGRAGQAAAAPSGMCTVSTAKTRDRARQPRWRAPIQTTAAGDLKYLVKASLLALGVSLIQVLPHSFFRVTRAFQMIP